MEGDGTKPTYVDPAGRTASAALPSEPPFFFKDVTARVFPIKANMARLSSFCDQYLNAELPPTIAHFRPSLPYVYLMSLNYGTMCTSSVQAQNVGWISQREVVFTIPLEWWRKVCGRLVFVDWALTSPFIFVDDEVSLTTGREVYGWPKTHFEVETVTPLWVEDPLAPTRVFSMRTPLFPKAYAGTREEYRVLLQIQSDPAPTFTEFPLDPNNPWSPLSVLPNATRALLGLMGDTLDLAAALPIRGYRGGRDLDSLLGMYGKAGLNLARLLPLPGWLTPAAATDRSSALSLEQITLKQFPAADEPSKACYQALVTSRVGVERLNRSGLLGDVNLLRGDPSGGFTVRIYRYTGQPIVESLGLEVTREEEGEGAPVAILKPTLPFWTDVDLYYEKGRVICSRTRPASQFERARGIWWLDEQTMPPKPVPPTKGHAPFDIPYNTARGAATQPVGGPFGFQDVNVQVYPLLAHRDRLKELLDNSLNEPLKATGMRFEAFGSYVYLIVTGYVDENGDVEMYSEANNIGLWAGREVAFSVPVKWYRGDDLISLAMVSPFVYRSSSRAVITEREVNGCPAVKATIESPPDVWLTDRGPEAGRMMLKLTTPVFPALYVGQRSQPRTLLEIDGTEVLLDGAAADWRCIAVNWGEELIKDLRRKARHMAECDEDVQNAKALALEILALGSPLNWVHLKNYRDAHQPKLACYQALVKRTRTITCIKDIREIEQRIHVGIHRYPGHPIQERLGLKRKYLDLQGGTVKEIFQPIRPFWMQVDIEEHLSEVLCWRINKDDWVVDHPWVSPLRTPSSPGQSQIPYFRSPDKTTGVGHGLPATFACDWRRLREQTDDWLRRDSARLDREAARRSIKNLSDAQVVIESMLSDSQRMSECSKRIKNTVGWEIKQLKDLKALASEHPSLWRSLTNDLKPALCIRRDSVGPEWQSVQERHKDLRLFQNEWWHLPGHGKSSGIGKGGD